MLDTAQESGREALLRLVDRADVFLTNVRPGGLKRAGLEAEARQIAFEALFAGWPRTVSN